MKRLSFFIKKGCSLLISIVDMYHLSFKIKFSKFIFIVITLSAQIVDSQTWDMHLNQIVPPFNPNIGTLSNDPLNFYTNGIERMTLSNSGVLKINILEGSTNRFLQTDQNGNIFPWTGSNLTQNSILFGDGSWRPNLITVEGEIMHIPLNTKFGLGTSNPNTEIDIVGNGRISNNLTINNKLHLGGEDQFALFNFIPSNGNMPAFINFRPVGGGSSNGNNSGNNGGEDDPDPLPNLECLNGNLRTVNVFSDLLCVKKNYNNTSLGNINIGHNGTRAFIETQGTNNSEPSYHPGNLFINAQCNRNVYFFSDNGASFSPHLNKIISINGRLNVNDIMQIGISSFTNFVETSTKLYVYASGIQDGVKVRHGGNQVGAGFRAIELSDSDKGISVYRGSQLNDGTEMFSVQGDGLTVISPINNKALSIMKNGNETFSIHRNGYTEIKVNSPSGMPNNRVLSVIDVNASRDLFVLKSNGKLFAREIEINLLQNFPDYVFNDDYKLEKLKNIEAYIKKYKHLPGFEKGEFYEKNGININEIILKQQEKIEELVLYLIDLEKKIDSLELR